MSNVCPNKRTNTRHKNIWRALKKICLQILYITNLSFNDLGYITGNIYKSLKLKWYESRYISQTKIGHKDLGMKNVGQMSLLIETKHCNFELQEKSAQGGPNLVDILYNISSVVEPFKELNTWLNTTLLNTCSPSDIPWKIQTRLSNSLKVLEELKGRWERVGGGGT